MFERNEEPTYPSAVYTPGRYRGASFSKTKLAMMPPIPSNAIKVALENARVH